MNILRLLFAIFIFAVSFCGILKSNEHYFLTEEHPIAGALHQIFSSSRVLGSLQAMEDAGFISPEKRPKGIVIGVHPKLKGYLVKMYLDTSRIDAYAQWIKRIEGALLVRQTIERYGLQDVLRVPKKWIYVLPTSGVTLHQSILVVEDMKLVKHSENEHLYKTAITEKHLDALFKVLVECKLTDSVLIDNIPFTKQKKIAIVDTEIAGRGLRVWLRLPRLEKYLSTEMQRYWRMLTRR